MDLLIVAAYIVMRHEDLEQISATVEERIDEILQAAFVGLI